MIALLLPLLVGTPGCGAGEKAPAGVAVHGQSLAEQLLAATDATREAGTAAFLSTPTYGTATRGSVPRRSSAPWTARTGTTSGCWARWKWTGWFPGNRRVAKGDAYGRAECERADAAAPLDRRRGGTCFLTAS